MKNYSFLWARRAVACVVCSLMAFSMVWAGQISQEEAAEIAARFTNNQPQLSRMHKAPRKAGNMRLAHKAMQNNSEKAAFYVFNQENDNGFVIVSADDRTASEVLGYGENGSFDFDRINPNLRWWLSRYADEITALQTIDDSEFDQSPIRKADQVTEIKNLLKNRNGKEITWYQESPYSDLCPMDERDNTRCLTGCVATAASQIMYKWEWPKKGTGTASYTWYDCLDDDCNNYKSKTLTVEPGNTTYDWDNMLPAYEGKSATSAQKTAVATLMYHAGVAAKMGYGGEETGGSGAWTDDMGYALVTYFGYKLEKFVTMYASKSKYQSAKNGNVANITAEFGVSREQIKAYFNADLEAGRPIIMGGEGNNGGHEFVCCGRNTSNQFYINWGWEGSNNGYFELSALKPGSYNFSSNLDAIIGLEPKEAGHAVVTNGTGCTITPSANFAANDEAFTANITPTDETYDFSSISVKLGNTTLTKTTHYTLSSDNKTLNIKASAITGDYSNSLTITAIWTKNRYKYELLGENSTPEMDEGMLTKNAALNLTIQPASGYTLNNAACWDVEMGGNKLTYGTGFTYNASTGAFAIAQVTGDVNILVYGGKEVTWKASGTTFATTFTSADKYVLPISNPEIECDSKEFVGWCATENYSSATTAPDFVKDGDAASKGMIFYAVFATKGEGGGSETTEKASSIAVGDEVILVYEEGSKELSGIGGSSTKYGEGTDYTTTPAGAYLLEVVAGSEANTFALKHGSDYLQWASGNSLNTKTSIDANSSWTITFSGDDAVIKNVADATRSIQWNSGSPRFACYTSAQKAVQLYKKAGGGASYSDYTTTCTPPCVGDLTGITLNTNDVKKAFAEGEAFSYDGLVVTANYDGCDSKIVLPTSVSAPDMSQIGKQEITVTYEGKSAKYEITIEALPTYAIRFFNNGEQVGATQYVKQNQKATKPASDPTACDGYKFVGWYTAALAEDNTEKPSYVTDFTATKDQDYYAAYSYTEEGESGGEPTIEKATSIAVGDEVILVYETDSKELSGIAGSSTKYGSGADYNTTPTGAYLLAVEAGSANETFALRHESDYLQWTNGNSLNTNTTIDANSSWTITFSGDDAVIKNVADATRSIQWNSGSPRFACYTTAQKAIQLYKKTGSGPSITTYYTTSPNCEECTSMVTVSKGTAEHGSFSLDYSGELNTCGGAVTVTVTANAEEGYRFKEIAQSGMTSGVTIDQTAKTVTYAKKSEGTSTIHVVFEAKPKFTVRFYNNGEMIGTAQTVTEGEKAQVPANPDPACPAYTFEGWWTETLDSGNTVKKTWVSDFTATKDQDYYAIFSKTVEGNAPSTDYKKISTMDELTDGNYVVVGNDAHAMKGEIYNSYYLATAGVSPSANTISAPAENIVWEISRDGNKVSFYNAAAEKYVYLYQAGNYYDLGLQNTPDAFIATVSNGNWSFESNTYEGQYLVYMIYKTTTHEFAAKSSTTTTIQLYKQADGAVIYYSSVEMCTPTSVENASQNEPVAIKAIMNGQIVIIRGEAVYTLTGARVQ